MTARVLVAAPACGHAATAVATGLMAALTARGVVVSGHKVGPDHTGPAQHARACGRPGRNLDPFLCGAGQIVPLLLHGSAGADVAVIDGGAGLFDQATPGSAQVARLTTSPVVLVLDSRGPDHAAAAVAQGPARSDPTVRVGGVILTNLTSARDETQALARVAAAGLPVLGAVPSGHLGPAPAAALAPVTDLGRVIGEHVDLDAVLALARTAGPLTGTAWDPAGKLPPCPGRVVAVAGGPAFTSYTETVELLQAAGARVQAFDPLRSPDLPAGTQALLLGGGFPQGHVAALSANIPLRRAVARFAADGGPVQAEGAGMVYLTRELDGAPMCGVIPAAARTSGHLTAGYRKAADRCTGHKVTGHECHETVTAYDDPDRPAAWTWTDEHGTTVRDGYRHGPLTAGYLHVHPAGHPWRLRFD